MSPIIVDEERTRELQDAVAKAEAKLEGVRTKQEMLLYGPCRRSHLVLPPTVSSRVIVLVPIYLAGGGPSVSQTALAARAVHTR